MAKIFILEDDPQRIKMFRIRLAEHELFFTDEVAEAKDTYIAFEPFDYYFLDHDLGGEIYVDSNYHNTGFQFAKFLAEQDLGKCQIVVHSLNPVGARNMLEVLPEGTQYVPFTQLRESLNGR